jgi:hypothetical protein
LRIEICRDDVLKQIGYKNPPQKVLLELIDTMLRSVEELLEPSMAYKEIQKAPWVPPFLEGARLKYIGIATIGSGLEKRVGELFEAGEPTEAYILDVIGSLASTKLGNVLWEEIKQDAAQKGLKKGVRRTPGCRGIDLKTQEWILEQMRGRDVHVEITPSYMMKPRKSLSFLARFGGTMRSSFSCAGCLQFSSCEMKG